MSAHRLLIVFALCLMLTACATRGSDTSPSEAQLPMLRLAPGALGHDLALEQQLVFVRGGQQRTLDALLEVDTSQVRLLVQAMGQPAVRLVWDGLDLHQQRAPWLPSQVRGDRVLRDLQFALWPLSAVRAALPSGWQVEETHGERRLLDAQNHAWLVTRDDGGLGNLHLRNLADGYELVVHSVPAQEDAP